MHRVPRNEIVLDAVVDQVDQVAVLADQHRNEEVSLKRRFRWHSKRGRRPDIVLLCGSKCSHDERQSQRNVSRVMNYEEAGDL